MAEKTDPAKEEIAAKEKAKAAFASGDYVSAITHFTAAIKLDQKNHLLYSNRSACYASLKRYQEALDDAKMCIQLKPEFVRGYSRKGLAEYYLEKYDDAAASYEAGLKLDPNNEQLKTQLAEAKQAAEANMFGSAQEVSKKLGADPIIKQYMKDPAFCAQMQQCQSDPKKLFEAMKLDPRFVRVMHVLSGIPMEEIFAATKKTEATAEELKRREEADRKFREMQEKEQAMSQEEKRRERNKELAEEQKVLGNQEYRAKRFNTAIQHYDKAIELLPEESIFYLNKAAVYMEEKKFEDALNVCDAAIKLAEAASPRPLEKIAKAYARKANCLVQMQKYDQALEMYDKALLEAAEPAVKEARKKCLKLKQQAEEKAYISPELSEQHREKGSKFFRDGNYAEAMREYNEAIKRLPTNEVLYMNRALTYLKFVEYGKALEDLERALKINPKYVKAYAKKGAVHYLMKDYYKSIEAYDKGLEIEPKNTDCLEGKQRTKETMYTTPPSEERASKAMADPEIRALMQDPRIIQLLKEMRESPYGVKPAATDPFVAQAVEKLIAAGILGMR